MATGANTDALSTRKFKMRIAHTLVTCSVIAASAALSGGCVDNRTTLYIENVLGQDAAQTECDTSAPGDIYLPSGFYDPGSGVDYVAYLVVANQMVPLGDNDTLRPETSRIQLEGAEVSIPGVRTYRTSFAATVNPDPSTGPGYVTVPVPMLQPDVDPGTYEVSVVVFGTTLGGLKVETNEFIFSILVLPEGSQAFCGDEESAADYDVPRDPCGRSGQDGTYYICSDTTARRPGCDVCP